MCERGRVRTVQYSFLFFTRKPCLLPATTSFPVIIFSLVSYLDSLFDILPPSLAFSLSLFTLSLIVFPIPPSLCSVSLYSPLASCPSSLCFLPPPLSSLSPSLQIDNMSVRGDASQEGGRSAGGKGGKGGVEEAILLCHVHPARQRL